jgi:hypothetical protein
MMSMTGGLLKTSSAAALLAVASFALSTQAYAADLGGDCCADLEERVAELEASTVRHANRRVSLTISGYVSEAVMYWNDGYTSDVNVIMPDTIGGGFTLSAEGKVNADLAVGAVMALNVKFGVPFSSGGAANDPLTSGIDESKGSLQSYRTKSVISVDTQYVYLRSASVGTLSMGYRNSTYKSFNNGAFDLGGASGINDYMGGAADTAAGIDITDAAGNATGDSWYSVLGNVGGTKGMVVRYDSPTFAGFGLSATWGEDDVGAAGLSYSGSFSGTDVVAGVAYETNSTNVANDSSNKLTAGASIYNAPSGLYLTGEYNVGYGYGPAAGDTADDMTAYFIKGGWRKNVSGLGETNLYLSYLHAENFLQVAAVGTAGNTEGQAFTVGAAQDLDSVGATLFLQYDNRQVLAGDATIGCAGDCEDLTTVMGGMKVTF